MRRLLPCILIAVGAALSGCGPAPDTTGPASAAPDDVWGRYERAAGGDALRNVRGIRATGISVDPSIQGNRRLTLELAAPAGYRQRELPHPTDGAPLRTLIGYNGTVGWWAGNTMLAGDGLSTDPAVRQAALTAAGRQNFINNAAGIVPLWPQDAGIEVTPVGVVQDGPDRGSWAVSLKAGGEPVGRLIFDATTHFPRRLVVPYHRHIRSAGGEYSMVYADYKDAGDGVMLPYRISREAPADTPSDITVTNWILSAYQINPVFGPNTFDPPGRQ